MVLNVTTAAQTHGEASQKPFSVEMFRLVSHALDELGGQLRQALPADYDVMGEVRGKDGPEPHTAYIEVTNGQGLKVRVRLTKFMNPPTFTAEGDLTSSAEGDLTSSAEGDLTSSAEARYSCSGYPELEILGEYELAVLGEDERVERCQNPGAVISHILELGAPGAE
jgi:hypothetical protein